MPLVLLGLSTPLHANCDADDNCTPVAGPQGPIGPTGPKGNNGTNGTNGANGKQGVQGVAGQDLTEETHYGVEGAIRLYDRKYVQLQVFDAWSTEHNLFIGGRVLIKIGKSYEETLIENLQAQIKDLNKIKGVK